jgi:hypothetical protein
MIDLIAVSSNFNDKILMPIESCKLILEIVKF